MNITREDINLLVREPSAAQRSRIAQKIARGYNEGQFAESELRLANEIFRLLLKDTEVRVRKLLAEELKSSLSAPHDIMLALAGDVEEVAVPVLQHSFVLSEDDLMAIVRSTRESRKLMAIASRESISRELAHALVETGDSQIVRTVIANKNASLADTTIEVVLEEFGKDNSVLEELVYRGGLPVAFAERLFSAVSDILKKQLTKKYRLKKHVVEDVVDNARETAVLQFMSPWMSQHDITNLIQQMHRNKRLSDSVVIRSLCIGDLRFFETSIAKRVGIPVSNARILLLDPGPLGFKALYESAGLPESFYEAVSIMLRLALEETEYGSYRADDFGERMIHRIRKEGFDRSIENMEPLLTMIGCAIHGQYPTLH
ncbi:MAG: DUF2336 domain-containing protein [Alphaproteobacteria bacterium]